ncbi:MULTISPECIES: hypothetical protein [unclassified Granulicatella]|uniref:hypothetical protein n=1 Tax=unclassified Granulicatella TaxID=2630493 RepID=UPI001073314D|nr:MULTISPECIES: hypothetical protein [unclassified Granulicatella]MBF0779790.1 hypothetical protein [Granulicatella sp. 19428wC4_WM01]TFU96192.1 hypothetical protein E4T68_01660 [Granulicatella sp. WM01]
MKNRKIIFLIGVVCILISAWIFSEKPKLSVHYKAYYLIRDENGIVWIGDKPGQKQAIYGRCLCGED